MDIKSTTYDFTVQREVIQITPELFALPYEFEFWMDDRGFKARQKMKGYWYPANEEPEYSGVEFQRLGHPDSETQIAEYGDYIVFEHWGAATVMTAEEFAASTARVSAASEESAKDI